MKTKFLLSQNCAFTLAEVMIVLGIIGIVAIFTIPILLSEVTERVNSNRQANIAQKVTKAVELMIVGGDYEKFETTNEFVDKLSKYLKIAKKCDKDNLIKCWPSKTVTLSDGTKYDVENAKTGIQLHTNNETDNVGLVLADGGSIILTYDPNAAIPNADSGFKPRKKKLPVGGGNSKEFAYTSNATDAIDFVMDVNGGQGPNAETDKGGSYYDIRSFKSASFSEPVMSEAACEEKFPGSVHAADPLAGLDTCIVNVGTSYSCISEAPYNDYSNCWAGARLKCSSMGMSLPSKGLLATIFEHKNQIEGLSSLSGNVWSNNSQSDQLAYYVNSNSTNSVHKYNRLNVICVGR